MLISVGAKGTVEDNSVYSMGPVVTCLDNKIRALQLTKKRCVSAAAASSVLGEARSGLGGFCSGRSQVIASEAEEVPEG